MRKGFTLIELMIVIAIIAIIAAIAIPNLLESRISSNEAAAATSLKSGIHPAQVQFQSGGYTDLNSNGIGDFASNLSFMAGSTSYTPVTGATAQALSLLQPSWNMADWNGTAGVVINGYGFDCDSANELNFGASAHPQDNGSSIGRRRFAINASGSVMATPPNSTNAFAALTGATNSPFVASVNFTAYQTGVGWTSYRR